MTDINRVAFDLIKPHIEIDLAWLEKATPQTCALLRTYLGAPEEDRTGLRLFTLIDRAHALKQSYETLEALLKQLQGEDKPPADDHTLRAQALELLATLDRHAEAYGEHRMAQLSEQDVALLRRAIEAPAAPAITIPRAGDLQTLLSEQGAHITIALRGLDRAALEHDEQGYSFTWTRAGAATQAHWPSATGMSFDELLSRIFDILVEGVGLQ